MAEFVTVACVHHIMSSHATKDLYLKGDKMMLDYFKLITRMKVTAFISDVLRILSSLNPYRISRCITILKMLLCKI